MLNKKAKRKEEYGSLDETKMVFLDETDINTGMARIYGRSPKGKRIIEYVPDVRFERATVLSSVRLDKTTVLMEF